MKNHVTQREGLFIDDLLKTNAFAFQFHFEDFGPVLIVTQAQTVFQDTVLCFVPMPHDRQEAYVEKRDIIAIEDNNYGDIRLYDWNGKFKLLRPDKVEARDDGLYVLKSGPIDYKPSWLLSQLFFVRINLFGIF